MERKSGIVMAAAAAMLFSGVSLAGKGAGKGHAHGKKSGGKVLCYGINECKGQGACPALDGSHGCAGKNKCKGHGALKLSKKECAKRGGKLNDKKS